MTDEPERLDVEALASRLRELRAEASERLDSLTGDLESIFWASLDSNADDEHDPEGATIAYERSQLSALVQAATSVLVDIDAATVRLKQGDYGICEVCRQRIPTARLDARPTARTCVAHASSDQR